jgi:hypothetical protein
MRICLLPHEKRKISFGMRPGRRPCREALLTWRQIPANPLEPLPKLLTANPTAVRCAVVAGLSEILCAGPGFHQVLTKRSPNMMANWVLASAHSRGGIFHC